MPRARPLARALTGVGVVLLVSSAAPAFAQRSPSPSAEVPVERPAPRAPADLVVLSGAVVVRRGETVGEVVVLHGSVEIAGVVGGDVVVLDGPIVVTGQVSGSVVSVAGRVRLGANAQVLGDVIARSDVEVAEGASVGGAVRPGTALTFRGAIDVFGPFATWLAVMASALLLGLVLLAVAPRASEVVAATGSSSPWRSASLGLGVAIVVPVLAALAIASGVVWPLGLAVLLALWFVASLGFAWSAFALGRRPWGAPRSRWLAFAFGWLLLAAFCAIPFVGGIVWGAAAIFGAGAGTLSLWRTRRHEVVAEAPPRGRHRAAPRRSQPELQPLVREAAMEEEGTGI